MSKQKRQKTQRNSKKNQSSRSQSRANSATGAVRNLGVNAICLGDGRKNPIFLRMKVQQLATHILEAEIKRIHKENKQLKLEREI